MKKDIKKSVIKINEKASLCYNLIGDSHRYKTDKGEISMIYPCQSTFNSYEIYCIEGNLFEDIERYSTKEKAEERINKLL
tara:strand:- start:1989 stop:2228 length:240 start_codon:yes stop_codon:yes gene_type:complete